MKRGTPFLLLALAVFLSCQTDGLVSVEVDGPIALVLVSGGDQSGPVGEELPDPVVVKVTSIDQAGQAIEGYLVNFQVIEGGGSMFAGAALTDADGMARDFWTLGPDPGENVLEVRSVNPTTGEKNVFGTFTSLGFSGETFPPLVIDVSNFAGPWTQGQGYSRIVAATGGGGGYIFSIESGSLPSGLVHRPDDPLPQWQLNHRDQPPERTHGSGRPPRRRKR